MSIYNMETTKENITGDRENMVSLPEEQLLNGYEYKYYRFRQRRNQSFCVDFTNFAVPHVKNLVTVVLPVYNGEDLVEESIRSILNQTYRDLELIIIDDGSSDRTPEIVDQWAAKDSRIVAVHQKNSKLPRALNHGFSLAKGEFLTWTSADNNMHSDFLEKLVGYMKDNPDQAMCYANIRAIDGNGDAMTDNAWYSRGEHSGNVYLPDAVLRLNTYPENTVGAAFMYRRAVPTLIGGYDPLLYTVEDYDYWMRINDFFSVNHVDFDDVIYDYRFHEKSLTAQAKELKINDLRDKLMLTEDYRQDWLLRPMCWVMEDSGASFDWTPLVQKAGHIRRTAQEVQSLILPDIGSCVVQVTFAENGESVHPEKRITEDSIRVLVCCGALCETDGEEFDLKLHIGEDLEHVPQGWIRAENEKTAFDLIQIYCKSQWFDRMMAENIGGPKADRKASIILCTYKRVDAAEQSLRAMVAQSADHDSYEILVVNNDPDNRQMYQLVQKINETTDVNIRYVDCPFPGLSAARNFSLYAARGEFLLYVDDDGIMEPDCLAALIKAFDDHPEAGVIGGQILLKDPQRFRSVILPGYESIWSERKCNQAAYYQAEGDWDFPYGCNYAIRRSILRDLGGFRITYGRNGKDFSGGEEIVLSHLVKRAGYQIGMEPGARIIHDVDPSRFSLEHVRQTLRASRLTNQLMKLDLYKNWDPYMLEETHMLQVAESRLAELKKDHVPENDLRMLYCIYDIDGTKDAIKRGHAYQRERQAASGKYTSSPAYVPLPAYQASDLPGHRCLLNRIICKLARIAGRILGSSGIGTKARNFAQFVEDNGLRQAWGEIFPKKKSAEILQIERSQSAVMGYLYDIEGRLDKKWRKTQNDVEQLSARDVQNYEDMMERFSDMALNSQREQTNLVKTFHAQSEELSDVQNAITGYLYDFEMRSRKLYLREQISNLRKKKKIIMVATAEHKNIGDAAITLAEQNFLLDYFPDYEQVEFSTFEMDKTYDFLQAILRRDDIIMIHGGGNMGSLYPEEENVHQRVVEDFPQNKIIVFPQSITYKDDAQGREILRNAEQIYNRHPDLTILARDHVSCKFAKAHFGNARVEMLPDMVLYLRRDYQRDRSGILLCMRTDDEKNLTSEQSRQIRSRIKKHTQNLTISNNMNDVDITREIRAAVVNRELGRFARQQVVVTDRLHGMIFAAITGTPVVAFKSADHKIQAFYDTYLKDSNAVFYIGDHVDQLDEALQKAMHVKEPVYPVFDGHYLERIKALCDC